ARGAGGFLSALHAARRFARDAKRLDHSKHRRLRRFPSRDKVVVAPSVSRRGGNANRNCSMVSIQRSAVFCRSCGCGAGLPSDPARPVYRTGGANIRNGSVSRNGSPHAAKKTGDKSDKRKKAPTGGWNTLPAEVSFFPVEAQW